LKGFGQYPPEFFSSSKKQKIMSFIIYGANGYTGKLTVELALKKGLKPTIAGRDEAKMKALAEETGLEYRSFSLNNIQKAADQLKDFDLVLNCAGPFSKTAVNMVEACLISKTHYLDITGEIEVFEAVKSYHQAAEKSGIVLMSGVGFDVVPTDCTAQFLHSKLPDATHLELAFMGLGGSISHGTMTTMVENLGKSGAARVNGTIVPKPTGHKGKVIDFGLKKAFCMTIPWGDVSTAHHTTGIPNIEAYTAVPKSSYNLMKIQFLFNPILGWKPIKKAIQSYVDKNIHGPTAEQNEKGTSLVWGKVTNAKGESKEARFVGPEGYKLTAEASLVIVQKVLKEKDAKGYHTPAGLFGHELLKEIEGCKLELV
jgi:short subunit dehydrogenase-like uncharacterized protein